MLFKKDDWVICSINDDLFLGQAMSSHRIDCDGAKLLPDDIMHVNSDKSVLVRIFNDVYKEWESATKQINQKLKDIKNLEDQRLIKCRDI